MINTSIDTSERITVEGVEILRYTEICGTITDHSKVRAKPLINCARCRRLTSLYPYCPHCIDQDLKEAGSYKFVDENKKENQ